MTQIACWKTQSLLSWWDVKIERITRVTYITNDDGFEGCIGSHYSIKNTLNSLVLMTKPPRSRYRLNWLCHQILGELCSILISLCRTQYSVHTANTVAGWRELTWAKANNKTGIPQNSTIVWHPVDKDLSSLTLWLWMISAIDRFPYRVAICSYYTIKV